MKRVILLLLALVLLLPAAVSCGNRSADNDGGSAVADAMGNTAGNLKIGGEFLAVGDWIYFPNPKNKYNLWRMKTDGSSMERVDDNYCFFLNYHKESDRIFCVDSSGYLKSMNPDGSGVKILEELLDGSGSISEPGKSPVRLILTNDKLYFSRYGDIWRMGLDGKGYTYILDTMDQNKRFYFLGERLYYVDVEDGMTYSVDLDGKDRRGPIESPPINGIPHKGRMIHAFIAPGTTKGCVASYNMAGKDEKIVATFTEFTSSYAVEGGNVFVKGDSGLYMVPADGSKEPELIHKSALVQKIYTANGVVFFEDGRNWRRVNADGTDLRLIEFPTAG